jgi:Flp pilus assembly protein TadG
MTRRFCRLAIDRAGTAGIEFALVLPIMLLLSLVALEATLAVMASMCLTNAAESVADIIAQQNSANWSISNVCTAGQLSMTPLSGTPLQIAVVSVTNNQGSGIAVDWQDTSCGGAAAISNATTLASPLIPASGDSVIVVQASYQYTPPIQYLFSSSITMTQISYQRPRNGSSVPAP